MMGKEIDEKKNEQVKHVRNNMAKFKRYFRRGLGLDWYPRVRRSAALTRFGSDYGGYYLRRDLLSKGSIVYSFGVGRDASFDIAVIEQCEATVFAFDPTPGSIEWVRSGNFPSQFHFFPYGIADFEGEVLMHMPAQREFISHSLIYHQGVDKQTIPMRVRPIHHIMAELGHHRLDVLKLDIEGAEYVVLGHAMSRHVYPTQIAVEFHHRFFPQGAWKTRLMARRLARHGYVLCAYDDSNSVATFVRFNH